MRSGREQSVQIIAADIQRHLIIRLVVTRATVKARTAHGERPVCFARGCGRGHCERGARVAVETKSTGSSRQLHAVSQ